MDILFSGLLGLSAPVLYVIGLVTVIRWLSRRGQSESLVHTFDEPRNITGPVDASVVAKLRQFAAKQTPAVSRELNRIANQLETGSAKDTASEDLPAAATSIAPPSAPKSTSWTSADLNDVMHRLDNINVMLYLGAFLIVVSAGIFVGYNFETLTGVFKTVFLGLFAALFYVTGLALFLRTSKLRPAGVTFTGIGLVLMPLVGLAAYNFTSLHDHGPATWFVTSLLTLAAYVATLALTRQTYVAYLMAFTSLSLFESSISLINLPIYWFGWGMALVSILLLTVSRTRLLWDDAADALMLSANVFVPISLFLSLLAALDSGLGPLGVTIGLAGVFYAAMANRFVAAPVGATYWGMALTALPVALAVGLWDSLSRTGIALVMLAVCGVYLAAEHLLAGRLTRPWHILLSVVTGLLPLAGLLVMYDRPDAICAILVVSALVNAELAARHKQSGLGLLAIMSLLAVPYVLLRQYLDPAQPWSAVSAALLVEVPVLVWWARRMRGWPESGDQVGAAGYLVALILALCAAALSSSAALLMAGLVVAGILYALSIFEERPAYLYGATASLYLAFVQLTFINDWSLATASLILLLIGAGLYALATVGNGLERALALRYSGLIGPFAGAFIGLNLGETQHLEPVLALAVGGGLLLIEAGRQDLPELKEVAGGVLILSLNWFMYVLEVTQIQAYTMPWAAYAAYLGYRRRDRGHEVYDGFIVVALGVLTIPLAGQALGENGQAYGLLLILEALALVFLGMALNFRLITLWGAATLVLEVLYQLRDFFYALPKYLISASLGLALLAIAIVMLQHRKNDE